MYTEFFGLKEAPFSIAPDPRYLFLSAAHREALAHLLYGLRGEGGFVVLTGEVGTGKTTVCRCLLEQVPENVQVALVLNPSLGVTELLGTICDDLGVSCPEGNASNKVFIDALNRFLLDSHARGLNTVLIVDEAQNLSADVLEQLRLLTNLETSSRKLLQIVLIGQPELRELLARSEMRQIAQRVTARYHLGSLQRTDLDDYLRHRLAVAGSRQRVFSRRAVGVLYRLSQGIPRLVNVLSDRALLGAYAQDRHLVDPRTLRKAAAEVLDDRGKSSRRLRWLTAALAASCLLFVVVEGPRLAKDYGKGSWLAGWTAAPPSGERAAAAAERKTGAAVKGWPQSLEDWGTKDLAAADLLRQWGLADTPPSAGDLCRQAADVGLDCLQKAANLGLLRRLDRPALLHLHTADGEPFDATLTGIVGDRVVLVYGQETRTYAAAELEGHWLGQFVLLWRPELPGVRGLMRGDEGRAVSWLSVALGQGSAQPERFDRRLEARVKQFQLKNGLLPDGIVGPQTLILLNQKLGTGAPRLTRDTTES